jgi:hypothetical protein
VERLYSAFAFAPAVAPAFAPAFALAFAPAFALAFAPAFALAFLAVIPSAARNLLLLLQASRRHPERSEGPPYLSLLLLLLLYLHLPFWLSFRAQRGTRCLPFLTSS